MSHAPKSATYHHGDLPAALRRAAWEIVGESGPRGLSLRECARRAGVSHAAPAHHFGSLEGLVVELVADGYERMVEWIVQAQREVEPLLGGGLGYIRFAIAYPQQFRLMQSLEPQRRSLPRLLAATDAAMACLRDALHAAWLARHGSAPDAHLLHQRVLLAWSAAHGYACLAIDHRTEAVALAPPEQLLAPMLPALLTP